MAYLDIETQNGGKRVTLDRDRLSIGRLSYNDIALPYPQISRQHAELRYLNGAWWIHDLHSTNGLHASGQRLSGDHKLVSGELVLLAPEIRLRFVEDGIAPAPAASQPPHQQGHPWSSSDSGASVYTPPATQSFQSPPASQRQQAPYTSPASSASSASSAPSHSLKSLAPRSPFADDEEPFAPAGMLPPTPPAPMSPLPPFSPSGYSGTPSGAYGLGATANTGGETGRGVNHISGAPYTSILGSMSPPLGPAGAGTGTDIYDPFHRSDVQGMPTAGPPPISGASGSSVGRGATAGPAPTLLHVCQTCGQLTAPDAVYCQSCRHSIAHECGNCRLSLLPIQDRCPRCQTPNPTSVRRAHRSPGG
ncbi:MAG: FHA domain-containing protein [Ktedonobacterales bacterium]